MDDQEYWRSHWRRQALQSKYLLHDLGQHVAFEETFRRKMGDDAYEQHVLVLKEVALERAAAHEPLQARCLYCGKPA